MVLFDTNILIDCFEGVPAAVAEVKRHSAAMISVVNWIEVMSGAQTPAEAEKFRQFLALFECLAVNAEVAERAAELRQRSRLKLPDAVILATAQVEHAILITRDRDFLNTGSQIRNPYKM